MHWSSFIISCSISTSRTCGDFLQGEGPFTVFAPTGQAFADAGIDLATLDTEEGKQTLSNILLYHVVAGAVPTSDVAECGEATAVNGQPLAFTVDDSVMVNDATVSIADVNTSNSVLSMSSIRYCLQQIRQTI